MKKIIVAACVLLLSTSTAFAAGADVTDTGALIIGGTADSGGTATASLTIGLSPKVSGRYFTDGSSETTAQWYAVATVHPGGNIGYGTAQDVNNIYMMWYVTGDATSTVTDQIPLTKDPVADTTTDPDAVAPDWTGNGWSLTTPTGPAE